jgi:hypothetical protein
MSGCINGTAHAAVHPASPHTFSMVSSLLWSGLVIDGSVPVSARFKHLPPSRMPLLCVPASLVAVITFLIPSALGVFYGYRLPPLFDLCVGSRSERSSVPLCEYPLDVRAHYRRAQECAIFYCNICLTVHVFLVRGPNLALVVFQVCFAPGLYGYHFLPLAHLFTNNRLWGIVLSFHRSEPLAGNRRRCFCIGVIVGRPAAGGSWPLVFNVMGVVRYRYRVFENSSSISACPGCPGSRSYRASRMFASCSLASVPFPRTR